MREVGMFNLNQSYLWKLFGNESVIWFQESIFRNSFGTNSCFPMIPMWTWKPILGKMVKKWLSYTAHHRSVSRIIRSVLRIIEMMVIFLIFFGNKYHFSFTDPNHPSHVQTRAGRSCQLTNCLVQSQARHHLSGARFCLSAFGGTASKLKHRWQL